jgi:hypothetical protein
MGGSSKAPAPDPQMGRAAVLSAQTGQEMLRFMRGQADVTNRWAAEDRGRYKNTFQPLEDQYIADTRAAADPAKIAANASARSTEAAADVRQQFAIQRAADNRRMTAMGVSPDSGRYAAGTRGMSNAEALSTAGASNVARRQSVMQDEAKAEGMRANVINLGKGLAVNPATSMGLSNSAGGAGFQGAMSGYGQQASILNQDYNNRLQAWQANQNSMAGLAGGVGAVLGATNGFGMFPAAWGLSSKDYKEDKKPAKGNLEAVRKMPVENWKYKDGIADGGRHIGPYAEDFSAATGQGDGKTIDLISQLGVTLGAVQELDRKVARLEKAA